MNGADDAFLNSSLFQLGNFGIPFLLEAIWVHPSLASLWVLAL